MEMARLPMSTLLAAASGGATQASEPPVMIVVFTGVALVFAILLILWLFLLLEGKLFSSLDKRKAQKQQAEVTPKQAPAAAVTPAAVAPAPVVEEGIPPEVVAAIAAAVAGIEGGKYTLRAVKTSQKGRGQWGLAGVIQSTEPF